MDKIINTILFLLFSFLINLLIMPFFYWVFKKIHWKLDLLPLKENSKEYFEFYNSLKKYSFPNKLFNFLEIIGIFFINGHIYYLAFWIYNRYNTDETFFIYISLIFLVLPFIYLSIFFIIEIKKISKINFDRERVLLIYQNIFIEKSVKIDNIDFLTKKNKNLNKFLYLRYKKNFKRITSKDDAKILIIKFLFNIVSLKKYSKIRKLKIYKNGQEVLLENQFQVIEEWMKTILPELKSNPNLIWN